MTRRGLLGAAASFGVGAGVDHVLASRQNTVGHPTKSAITASTITPFYGPHQAGIATPAQEHLHFAAFDVTSNAVSDLRDLLQAWTAAAAALTRGARYQPGAELPTQPPSDTGEAIELQPSQLTLTFGFGPSLFGVGGPDRFGLARRRPSMLKSLPPFRGESLQPARSGGDLCVQACADDPQVAFHAIHVLSRIANGTAVLRWSQLGFGRTSSTTRSQTTPRNLMGFKDGTDNIRAEDTAAMNKHVWVQSADGPDWMAGGTYLIARRITILFDVWDATSLEGQERVVGRKKDSGAPLGGRDEYDPVDLKAMSEGQPVIPVDAHIRLASPATNGGERILRRGYSFSEGTESGSGSIEAGLFFIAFQRDPRQFTAIQKRLAASDALNRHTVHMASAIFACPTGLRSGGFVGQSLFS
jgi:deferrochelatase/peroxidase EfeB